MNLPLPVLFAFGVLSGLALGAVLLPIVWGNRRLPQSLFPSQKQSELLSSASRAFRESLCEAVGADWKVRSNVRLASLVQVKRGAQNRLSRFNRIALKRLDFVLCSQDGGVPALVIELDKLSQRQTSRHKRDGMVDTILDSVSLPILRLPAQSSYSTDELILLVREKIYATRNSGPLGDYALKRVDTHAGKGKSGLARLIMRTAPRRLRLFGLAALALAGAIAIWSLSYSGLQAMPGASAANLLVAQAQRQAFNDEASVSPASAVVAANTSTPVSPQAAAASVLTGLNLRSGPGVQYEALEVLAAGSSVKVLSKAEGDWVKVQSPEGRQGWVAGRYLKPLKP